MILQALADFVLQRAQNRIEQFGLVATLISEEWMGLSSKKPGNRTPQQILRDGRDGGCSGTAGFCRPEWSITPHARVGRDQLVRELRDRFHREGFTTKRRRNK